MEADRQDMGWMWVAEHNFEVRVIKTRKSSIHLAINLKKEDIKFPRGSNMGLNGLTVIYR